MKRRRNNSVHRTISKLRKSIGEQIQSNESCIILDDPITGIHDDETVLVIEDQTADERTLGTAMEDVSNSFQCDKPRKKKCTDTPKSNQTSKRPFRFLTSPTNQHSTPISKKKNTNLNISNISAVKKSPKQRLSREISNLSEDIKTNYVTIDLTHGTRRSKSIIDLTTNANSKNSLDSSIIDLEEGECSTTQSDITVINVQERNNRSKEKQIADGIAKMNASDKDRLLTMITKKIFNGCDVPKRKRRSILSMSAEDSYIRDMIEGNIRDSVGRNVYNPPGRGAVRTGLRMVVIDGSNVAMRHGNGRIFSVKGLKICIDYFLKRGHTVKAFVPRNRVQAGRSSDPQLLDYLQSRGLVVYTPSRKLPDGRCISSYDDRFIIQCAAEFGGVIVSQDNYLDLAGECESWADTIEHRLLQFTWVEDMIMFPQDPLGKGGPSLDDFLRHTGC